MSSLLGRSSAKTANTPASAFSVQTSVSGLPIPLVWGKARIAGNLIYYADFQAIPHNSGGGGGKGGLVGGGSGGKGGSQVSYTYQVAVALGLCQGPIQSIDAVYVDKAIQAPSALNIVTLTGSATQAPWGYLTALHPSQALAYRGLAYAAAGPLQLGASTELPNLSFDVHAVIADAVSGAPDADPSAVIVDFLANPNYGVGLPASRIADLSDYTAYGRATGMLVSPKLDQLTSAQDFVNGLLEATNAEAVWSQGQLRIVPRGDTAIVAGTTIQVTEQHTVVGGVATQVQAPGTFTADGGVVDPSTGKAYTKVSANPAVGQYVMPAPGQYGFNGANVGSLVAITFTYAEAASWSPPAAPLYAFGDDDYVVAGSNTDMPVQITRSAPQDAKNSVTVNYLDRSNAYASTPTPAAKDDAAIQAYGLRADSVRDYPFFAFAQAAQMSAHLALGRLAVRNTYVWTVGQKYKLLDPMDLVSLTDTASGINAQWVRILEITENADLTLTMTGEDYLTGSAAAPVYGAEPPGGFQPNYEQDPGFVNAPLIFEPPSTLTGGTTELWVAVSGASPVWGGCDAWLSYDDTNYSRDPDGHLKGPCKHGYTMAALSVDPAATLAVDISQVPGAQLTTVTATEAQSFATLCWLDGELIAYTTATLTALGHYTLGGLVRGCYGTPVKAHAAGLPFARLDASIIRVPYNKALIGGALFFKFLSFNLWGRGSQLLSAVTEIEYTFGGGQPPGVITGIVASAAQSGLAVTLKASWAADALSATYQAGISDDGGTTWRAVYDGPDLATRVDGLKASVALFFRVRGITSSGIPGVYAQVAVPPAALTSQGSGYTDFITYKDISQGVTDAALTRDLQADQGELALFAGMVAQDAATTLAQAAANASAAAAIQLSSGQLPLITASFAASATGLVAQVASINSSLMAQIAQETKDVVALGGRIDTLSQAIGSNSAFVTGISLAQANVNGSNAIRLDEVASQEAADNDAGELADFVILVQQGKLQAAKDAAGNAAQAAIVVQQATNTSAISAGALYSVTIATKMDKSFAAVSDAFTAQSTTNQAIAGRTSKVESALGDPLTGLSATYSEATATAATVGDPVLGNGALATRAAALEARAGQDEAAITSTQTVAANQAMTIASLSTTVQANFQSQGAAISSLQTTTASQGQTIASLSTTVQANYNSQGAAIAQNASATVQNSGSITTLQQTVSDQGGSISTLSATVQSNYSSQGAAIQQNAASIGSVSQTVSSQGSSLATLQGTVSANFQSLSGSIGTANQAIQQNSAAIGTLQQTSANQAGSIASIGGQVTANYNAQGAAIAQNGAAITTLQQASASQGQSIALTSSYLQAGSSTGNDLANSDLVGYDGWNFGTTTPAAPIYNAGGFCSPTVNTLAAQVLGTTQTNQYADWDSPDMPADAGVAYEASVAGAFQGPAVLVLYLGFKDRNGAVFAYAGGWTMGTPGDPSNGDQAHYTRFGGFATAPLGAASRFLKLRTLAPPTNNTVVGFFARPLSKAAAPGQTILSPYTPGTQANVPALKSSILSLSTTVQTANSTFASQIGQLQSQIGDPNTGLSATYSTAAATKATVNDPNVGNQALTSYAQGLASRVGNTEGSISTLQGTVANQGSALSQVQTNLKSVSDSLSGTQQNVATISSSVQTLSTNYGSLSSQITSANATSAYGTASGQIGFTALSDSSGATVGYSVLLGGLSGSGSYSFGTYNGYTYTTTNGNAIAGGFQVLLKNGKIYFVVQATQFLVQDPTTQFVPFGIQGGQLYLQGVTNILSTVQSSTKIKSASTGATSPVMSIDFQNGAIAIYDQS